MYTRKQLNRMPFRILRQTCLDLQEQLNQQKEEDMAKSKSKVDYRAQAMAQSVTITTLRKELQEINQHLVTRSLDRNIYMAECARLKKARNKLCDTIEKQDETIESLKDSINKFRKLCTVTVCITIFAVAFGVTSLFLR